MIDMELLRIGRLEPVNVICKRRTRIYVDQHMIRKWIEDGGEGLVRLPAVSFEEGWYTTDKAFCEFLRSVNDYGDDRSDPRFVCGDKPARGNGLPFPPITMTHSLQGEISGINGDSNITLRLKGTGRVMSLTYTHPSVMEGRESGDEICITRLSHQGPFVCFDDDGTPTYWGIIDPVECMRECWEITK